MFFLLRAAFWLSLMVLLIPADPAETSVNGASRPVTTFEAIGAAHSTLRDVEGFCERNPAACDTGRVAIEGFGAKARTGARWIHDRLESDRTGATAARTRSDEPKVATRASAFEPSSPTRLPSVPLPQARPIS